MTTEPLIRGFVTHALLGCAEVYPQGIQRAIKQHVSQEALDECTAVARLGWLPLRYHIELVEACRAELGDRELQELFLRIALVGMSSPMLKGFLDAGVRMFGITPVAMLKWAHRAWPTLLRDYGTIQVEFTGPKSAMYSLVDLPTKSIRSEAFAVGFTGSLRSYLVLTKSEGTVSLKEFDPVRGCALYSMEW